MPKPHYIRCQSHEEVRALLHYLLANGQVMRDTWEGVEGYLDKWPNRYVIGINQQRPPGQGTLSGFSQSVAENLGHRTISYVNYFAKIRVTAPVPMNAPGFTKADPDFRIGFEIEGCMHRAVWPDFVEFLSGLYEGGDHPFDRSIKPPSRDFHAFEFATPALPLDIAADKLGWLLGTLSILSDEKVFETNQSCGFHVSISERGSFRSSDRSLRNHIAHEFMQRFDPLKWRATFNRDDNRYCKWVKPSKKPHDLDNVPVGKNNCTRRTPYGHYWAINACHLHRDRASERRIEVRVCGNRNYHKHRNISAFIDEIVEAMQAAYATL